MLRQSLSALLASAIVLAFAPVARGEMITGHDGLNNLGTYTGVVTYSATDSGNATLTVTLTNTSPAANGGYLTAFVLNNPFDRITGVSLSSTDPDFVLLGGPSFQNGINGAPFGDFDIGAGTGGAFEGGGPPSKGIGVGSSATFTFTLTGTQLDTLSAGIILGTKSEFVAGQGKETQTFVARFRGFNDGGSDKVPDEVVAHQPEPGTVVLLGLGMVGLAGGAVLRRNGRLRSRTPS